MSCWIWNLSESSVESFFHLSLHPSSRWYHLGSGLHHLLLHNRRKFCSGLCASSPPNFNQQLCITNIILLLHLKILWWLLAAKSSSFTFLCPLFQVLHDRALICLLCVNPSIYQPSISAKHPGLTSWLLSLLFPVHGVKWLPFFPPNPNYPLRPRANSKHPGYEFLLLSSLLQCFHLLPTFAISHTRCLVTFCHVFMHLISSARQ